MYVYNANKSKCYRAFLPATVSFHNFKSQNSN